jgi:hypothetical protein
MGEKQNVKFYGGKVKWTKTSVGKQIVFATLTGLNQKVKM